jgi:hypothetical protein
MRQISNPARSNGVATAKIPKGAVASELANDGKKKTILRDLDNGFSSLKKNDRYFAEPSCHRNVSNLSGVCCNCRRRSDGRLWTPGGQLVALCGGCGPGVWAPTGRERFWKNVRTQSSPGGPRQPMGGAGRRGRRVCAGVGEPFWPTNAGIAVGRGGGGGRI